MIRSILTSALMLCASVALSACDFGDAPFATSREHWDRVTVVTASGEYEFFVEIADTDAERARGLMYRRELADDAGMLFLFEEPGRRSFWMRNTYVSLDIIYIDENGHVVSVADHTIPLSDQSLPSAGPALVVLEVVAGTADRIGIERGTEVRHPYFDEWRSAR